MIRLITDPFFPSETSSPKNKKKAQSDFDFSLYTELQIIFKSKG
jgi:hypothetical protein